MDNFSEEEPKVAKKKKQLTEKQLEQLAKLTEERESLQQSKDAEAGTLHNNLQGYTEKITELESEVNVLNREREEQLAQIESLQQAIKSEENNLLEKIAEQDHQIISLQMSIEENTQTNRTTIEQLNEQYKTHQNLFYEPNKFFPFLMKTVFLQGFLKRLQFEIHFLVLK